MKIVENYSQIFKQEPDFVVFDTETTGFSGEKDRVIELGAIRTQTVEGKINQVCTVSSLINPNKEIKNSRIHGITDNMVKDCAPMKVILEGFFSLIQKPCVLIAHNAQFDIRMMTAEMIRNGFKVPAVKVICTMKLCKLLFPGLKSYSQVNLATHFGINIENAHRAEDDARVCLAILEICIKEMVD